MSRFSSRGLRYVTALLAMTTAWAGIAPSAASAGSISAVQSPVFADGDAPTRGTKRYIVRYLNDVTVVDKEKEVKNVQGTTKKNLSKVFNGAIVDLTPLQVTLMRKSAKVLWVEEDKGVRTQASESPPGSWGLDRIDQDTLPLNNTYSYATTGAGVTAYVVDTGILATHSEFSGRVSTTSFFDAFGGTGTDCNGHGTHVAGTIAGATLGVAPAASLIAVRAMDCVGSGAVSDVISGIDWVINHHTSAPAVMNLSLGSVKSDSLNAAIDRAFADGITVVVAAGNANVDACTMSPASNKESALTVGATTITDARASYSNYGECLDIFAPGSNITSAWYANTTATSTYSGTSVASPHVAGLAARYLSAVPTASPATVMNSLISGAVPNIVTNPGMLSPNKLAHANPETVPTSDGTITTNPGSTSLPPGSGTEASPSVPGVSGTPIALAGAQSSWLEWTVAAAGGSPITGYVVRIYRSGKLSTQVIVEAGAVHTINDLRAGSSHYFTVAAMNGVGVGPFSALSNTVVPLKNTGTYTKSQSSTATDVIPNAPTRIAVSQTKSNVVVLWNPSTNAVASTHAVLFYQKRKVVAKVVTLSSGGVRIFGLKKGTYAVRIQATNNAGSSVVSQYKTIRVK